MIFLLAVGERRAVLVVVTENRDQLPTGVQVPLTVNIFGYQPQHPGISVTSTIAP